MILSHPEARDILAEKDSVTGYFVFRMGLA